MADQARQKAVADVRRAQARFERLRSQLDDGRDARRKSFEQARAAGLSLADIAKATGLHRSRVDQILHGK
jgi:DNA-directed RNA polymerase specialized sigma24 family protein